MPNLNFSIGDFSPSTLSFFIGYFYDSGSYCFVIVVGFFNLNPQGLRIIMLSIGINKQLFLFTVGQTVMCQFKDVPILNIHR